MVNMIMIMILFLPGKGALLVVRERSGQRASRRHGSERSPAVLVNISLHCNGMRILTYMQPLWPGVFCLRYEIWTMYNVKSWYDYHDRVCLVTIFVQLWWWYHLENTMHYICQTSPASLVVIFFNPKTASLVWHGTAQRAPHALYPVAQKRRQGKGPRTGKDFAVIACICMTKTMNWPLAACYQFCPSRRTIWYSSDWNRKGYRNCFDPTWTW